MAKRKVGEKVHLKTGTGLVIEAVITRVLDGYYDLESKDSSFPLTLSEKSLEKIEASVIVPLLYYGLNQ